MIFENTGSQEEMFLAFCAGEVSYVLPLSDVGQIAADTPRDVPEILLSGRREPGGCSVIFQDELGLAALSVGRMTGIVRLPPACQYEMPEPARSPQNRWIAGVAFLESTGGLCYLLDCRQLRKRFLQESV